MAHPASPPFGSVGSCVERFVIKAKLGSGGIGEVFLADDTVLKRPVAMKAIRPEHSQDSKFLERLLKEAERASQLNDEHIARIFDVVERDGRGFLVMEYVEGQTLRSRFHQGRLQTQEFFSIAEQCLSGLAAAHRHGIVHCDLKPENIMLTPAGVVKILDFGFARRCAAESQTISAPLLGGTLAYLPPDVLLGATPDQRSDLFSLGIVFYEALAGKRPSTLKQLGSAPAAPDPLPGDVPPALEQVIDRMLASRPEDRYQSCGEALAALRASDPAWPARQKRSGRMALRIPMSGVLGLVLAVVFAGALLKSHIISLWSPRPVSASSRLLVVLPFKPSSDEANARAFSRGLTEALSAKLGELSDRYPLETVALSEVNAQKVDDAQQARSVLGASLALEGSLQQSGSTVRVIYSLVDTRSLRQIHSGVITADASNTFAVEDRVIDQVLSDLNIELDKPDRGRVESHGTTQAEAYEFYLRGRGYLQEYFRTENLDQAIAAFSASLKADPNFALAYAGLGQTYLQQYYLTHSLHSMTEARNACSRAVQLNPASPDGEICLGMLFNNTGDYKKAAEHLERAVELDGSRDESYRELGVAYEGLKRLGDAEALLKRAIALRPQYWAGYQWLGRFYSDHGRYDEAVEQFKRVVALAPDSFSGYSNLGAVYLRQGNYADAKAELERSISIRPTAPALNNLGALHFYQQKYQEATRSYERAAQMTPDDYIIFGNLGEAYALIAGAEQKSRSNYAHALELAEQSLRVNAHDAAAMLDAAFYAAVLGQNAKAERYRTAALKISGKDKDPQALLRSAQVLAQLRRDPAAIAELQRALKAGLSASQVTDDPSWQRFKDYPTYRAMITKAQGKTNNEKNK